MLRPIPRTKERTPLPPTSDQRVPDVRVKRVSSAVEEIDDARRSLLSAAKHVDKAELPRDLHRDVLMAMDYCRDLEARLTEFGVSA